MSTETVDRPSAAPPAASAPNSSWLVPLLVLIVGMFMSVLDISIVNVAIPTIQRDFGATTDGIQWITTAYTLSLGVVVPLSGWLGERLGQTRIYLYSLIGFAAFSALCGLAWDLNSMVAFRILQAVPGGILPVVTMTIVYLIVPREKMGAAMGIYGLGVVVGPAIGPTLGGYLVEYIDWRLIFYINVPVGILGAILGYLLLPKVGEISKRPLDWWGFLTIGAGLFALLLATSQGQSWGWDGYRVRMLLVAGALLVALFVVIELERDQPLLNLRVFKSWQFVNSLLLISILSVGLYAILFYLPLYLQESQGLQPLRVGLILLPEALMLAVFMPIAGTLYDKIGPRWPAVVGLLVAVGGGFLLCGINPDMTQGEVVFWTSVRAIGNGLALMPIMTAGLSAIPPDLASSGATVNNITQRVSASLGLAGMTVLATNQANQLMADRAALIPASPQTPLAKQLADQGLTGMYGYYQQLQGHVMADAYSNVFLVCAVLTVIGLVLAFFIKRPEAFPTADAATAEPAADGDADGDANAAPAATAHPTREPAAAMMH
jgi:EmrB/QacA subfamily drug resistance transporter